ncbi:MAG: hypothetical protein AMDU2_EPLC00005G0157 [Thermoplasmatales archaeon E-plasma]|nr:MAG: hypothetical protein AMDU2_EPLC00005G0157 [Thermoplasmatales archaeon E-plasma]
MLSRKVMGIALIFVSITIISFSGVSNAQSTQHVLIINLNEEIDPGSATMISDALSNINPTNTKAVIINMNTPGWVVRVYASNCKFNQCNPTGLEFQSIHILEQTQ